MPCLQCVFERGQVLPADDRKLALEVEHVQRRRTVHVDERVGDKELFAHDDDLQDARVCGMRIVEMKLGMIDSANGR